LLSPETSRRSIRTRCCGISPLHCCPADSRRWATSTTCTIW
jgi:hypothetical protein